MECPYYYDGSFDGFLSAVFTSYYGTEKPCSISRSMSDISYQTRLFRGLIIETSKEQADRVYHSILKNFSKKSLRYIYYTFLSEIPGMEMKILYYLKLGWKIGRKIDDLVTEPGVRWIHETARKVSREKHRFLGLIRFIEMDGFYYAPFEPDFNILELLADHFAGRLTGESWILHDRKRGKAVLFNRRFWILTNKFVPPEIEVSVKEETFQTLWRQYFRSTWIRERTSKDLQRQFMPEKYWKYLIEKN